MTSYFSTMKNSHNKDLHKGKFSKLIKKLHNFAYDAFSVYNEKGFEITNVNGRVGDLVLGDYSYGKINLHAYSSYFQLEIGRYTSISEISIIIGGNHHTDVTTYPFRAKFQGELVENDNFLPRPVKIGHDVWIGYGAIILDGVDIGTGAIIGAGAVIRRDIPPYAVVMGNPGIIIRYRFNEKEIEMLVKSKWWELPKEALLKIENLLYSKDVKTFVSKVQELKNVV